MSNKFLMTILSIGCSVAVSISAFAADPIGFIGNFSGQTFIKHNGIVYSAAPRAAIYPGDEVVTVNGAQAKISFTNGCGVNLGENSFIMLTNQDQCTAASRVVPLASDSPYYGYTFAQANGNLKAGRVITGGLESGTGILIPAVLVTGAGLTIVAQTGNNDSTATSP